MKLWKEKNKSSSVRELSNEEEEEFSVTGCKFLVVKYTAEITAQ